MRDLTLVQVLTIILQRLEKRAKALEGVRLESFNMTVGELRRFAQMVKSAREYLQCRHVR
jgi:hypothetical protein